MFAADKGHKAIAGALLAAGADTEAQYEVRGGGVAGRVRGGSVWFVLISF